MSSTQLKRSTADLTAGALILLTFGLMLGLPSRAADVFSALALPVLAWGAAVLNYWVLRRLHPALPDHRLVRLLLPAGVLWALGETIWAVLFFVTEEPPDPSVADIFWLLGDVVFLYALLSALRWYPQRRTPSLHWIRWGVLVIILGLSGYFVLWPIAQEFTPEAWLETLWALVYPVFDTLLLMAVLTLAIQMRRGQLWKAWLLIALSVVAAAFADLLYAYLDWNDLYYADSTILLSRATDWFFLLDYILYGWGMYKLYQAWQEIARHATPTLQPVERPHTFTNTLGLVFVNQNGEVIGYSGALWEHLSVSPQIGRPLAEIWPDEASRSGWQALLATLRHKGEVSAMPLSLPAKSGERLTCWISGVAVAPGGEYEGSNLLLRAYTPGQFDPYSGFTEEERGLVDFLARESGIAIPDYRQAMQTYAQTVWKTLLEVLARQFGPLPTQGLVQEMQAAHGEAFQLSLEQLTLTERAAAEPNFARLQEQYVSLLQDLYQRVAHLLSAPLALYEWAHAESALSTTVLWMAEEAGLRPKG